MWNMKVWHVRKSEILDAFLYYVMQIASDDDSAPFYCTSYIVQAHRNTNRCIQRD